MIYRYGRPRRTQVRLHVNLLITEVTGARHRQAERFLRTCASAHAERYTRADDSDGAEPSFYARASALLSAACLRGLGDEHRSG
ncbi:hypothetical protein AB1Y20_017747 [Prymnesium parvum]|uniref:Uncharacterized protein n=1 Tax=Prymnesium parvum TaxID=97485 RepID=A0AB34JPB4_PRYPA